MPSLNPFKRVMIDIETLSTRPNSVIVAVGACYFYPEENKIGETFYRIVDVRGQADFGLEIDADTVCWWMKQSAKARSIFDSKTQSNLQLVLVEFARFLEPNQDSVLIYGNGKDFDNVILSSAYYAVRVPRPWGKYNDACYRELKRRHPDIKCQIRHGVHHNALDDAVFQARHAIEILRAYPDTK